MIPFSRRWFLLAAFIVALMFTAMFVSRAVRHARRLPGERPPIQAWMTIPFIARGAAVPPPVLFEAIGLPPDSRDRRPIDAIARAQGVATADVIARLETAIEQFRPLGAPPPPPHPTPEPAP